MNIELGITVRALARALVVALKVDVIVAGGTPAALAAKQATRTIQFGRESREPLELPLGIPVFNHDVAILDITEVTQPLTEGLVQLAISGQVGRQVAYSSDPPRLLPLGGKRSGEEVARQTADKHPAGDHWMTSSARDKSDGGIVSPRALAVLRLMTNSNFVGCSIGRLAGLAPLRILST